MADLALVQEEPRGPSQLIEIPVAASQVGLTKVTFPDIQQLRSQQGQVIVIKGIRVITDAVLTNSPTLGFPTAPLTELQKMTLTIYCEGWEKGQLIPVLSMNDIFTEGTGIPFKHAAFKLNDWTNVDWSKTFIQWANGTAIVGAPYVIIFDVDYLRLNAAGAAINGK